MRYFIKIVDTEIADALVSTCNPEAPNQISRLESGSEPRKGIAPFTRIRFRLR